MLQAPELSGVSLNALLAAKELRAQRQQAWLTRWRYPLISLTLVTPGPVKTSIRYRNSMGIALQACDQLLWQQGWEVLEREVFWLPTGSEAFWCVKQSAEAIKAELVALESEHPLGRIWDFDVIPPQGAPLSRRSFAHSARSCLLCDDDAHACARSRRHPLPEVVARTEQIIDNWFRRD